jgi:NAD(P)-dependent dehydrogenase (short-subunit alcohol dehydrogenase family)
MSEKIAVITGASSGFGLLGSIELAKAGFHVIATMRNLEKRGPLDQAAGAAAVASRVIARRLDVTHFEELPAFAEGVIRDYGRIDVLVNNAGFAVAGFAEDVTLDELRLQFETNFFGAVAMTKAVLPFMRRQRCGHILQLSSILGLHGSISISSYSASKHALEGWSESLRMEVDSLGIKVVLIEPGSFDTGIWTHGAVMGKDARKSTSPNFQRSLKMRSFIQKIPKADPIAVARVIARVAKEPNPKLRYVIGRDARMQLWMKRVLPWKWYERIIANYLKLEA